MPWPCSGCMHRKRQWGQDTARKRCCSNQINSYFLILCRALRRAASVCSLAWSGDVLPGGVVLPRVVGMRPKYDAGGNRTKVMSTDRHHTFCVTIYWGCCAGCTGGAHTSSACRSGYLRIPVGRGATLNGPHLGPHSIQIVKPHHDHKEP